MRTKQNLIKTKILLKIEISIIEFLFQIVYFYSKIDFHYWLMSFLISLTGLTAFCTATFNSGIENYSYLNHPLASFTRRC